MQFFPRTFTFCFASDLMQLLTNYGEIIFLLKHTFTQCFAGANNLNKGIQTWPKQRPNTIWAKDPSFSARLKSNVPFWLRLASLSLLLVRTQSEGQQQSEAERHLLSHCACAQSDRCWTGSPEEWTPLHLILLPTSSYSPAHWLLVLSAA